MGKLTQSGGNYYIDGVLVWTGAPVILRMRRLVEDTSGPTNIPGAPQRKGIPGAPTAMPGAPAPTATSAGAPVVPSQGRPGQPAPAVPYTPGMPIPTNTYGGIAGAPKPAWIPAQGEVLPAKAGIPAPLPRLTDEEMRFSAYEPPDPNMPQIFEIEPPSCFPFIPLGPLAPEDVKIMHDVGLRAIKEGKCIAPPIPGGAVSGVLPNRGAPVVSSGNQGGPGPARAGIPTNQPKQAPKPGAKMKVEIYEVGAIFTQQPLPGGAPGKGVGVFSIVGMGPANVADIEEAFIADAEMTWRNRRFVSPKQLLGGSTGVPSRSGVFYGPVDVFSFSPPCGWRTVLLRKASNKLVAVTPQINPDGTLGFHEEKADVSWRFDCSQAQFYTTEQIAQSMQAPLTPPPPPPDPARESVENIIKSLEPLIARGDQTAIATAQMLRQSLEDPATADVFAEEAPPNQDTVPHDGSIGSVGIGVFGFPAMSDMPDFPVPPPDQLTEADLRPPPGMFEEVPDEASPEGT